jgi:hypothetical protein
LRAARYGCQGMDPRRHAAVSDAVEAWLDTDFAADAVFSSVSVWLLMLRSTVVDGVAQYEHK